MTTKKMFLHTLAEELSIDRSHLRRRALKLGVRFSRERDRSRGNQSCLCLTPEDASILRETRGICLQKTSEFYLLLPDPDLRPLRLKAGISSELETRLAAFKCICPESRLVGRWRCPRQLELAAMLLLQARFCCTPIGEIFDFEHTTIGDICGVLAEFFAHFQNSHEK